MSVGDGVGWGCEENRHFSAGHEWGTATVNNYMICCLLSCLCHDALLGIWLKVD